MNTLQIILQKGIEEDNALIKLLQSLQLFETGVVRGVCINEMLTPKNTRHWMRKFDDTKKKNITGLMERKSLEVVLKEDVPPNANMPGGRLVLVTKNIGTNIEVYKARFVVQ